MKPMGPGYPYSRHSTARHDLPEELNPERFL